MAKKKVSGATGTSNLEETIKARAYELYVEDGYEHGRDLEHWLRAEAEVLTAADLKPASVAPKKKR